MVIEYHRFSLEKLIGKLKTTPISQTESGDSPAEPVANGTTPQVAEKKSRRKGNPVK